MPNRILFSVNGNATDFYNSLNTQERNSLDEALEYIRDFPFEHGDTVIRRIRPPVVIYLFRDDYWRISYSLSTHPTEPISVDISIFAIAYA
ncbi:MAG: hypothetical protein F4X34_04675 [Chloroflexi bacterium]|nr:hypothetical protein [Chloroflexota bacterium]